MLFGHCSLPHTASGPLPIDSMHIYTHALYFKAIASYMCIGTRWQFINFTGGPPFSVSTLYKLLGVCMVGSLPFQFYNNTF